MKTQTRYPTDRALRSFQVCPVLISFIVQLSSANSLPCFSFLSIQGIKDRDRTCLNSEAVGAYCDLAKEQGLTPSQLALSWCYHRELVASTIMGATTMEELEENLDAYDCRLSDDCHDRVKEIYKKYTDPARARG